MFDTGVGEMGQLLRRTRRWRISVHLLLKLLCLGRELGSATFEIVLLPFQITLLLNEILFTCDEFFLQSRQLTPCFVERRPALFERLCRVGA